MQKQRASNALLNAMDVYAKRAMLASYILIFRRHVAYNVGYCRSLYFQKMLGSLECTSVKGDNGKLRAYTRIILCV